MSDGGEVSITFTSKEQKALWDAVTKLATNVRQVGDSADEATKKLGQSELQLKRFAESLKATHATPLERLNAQLKKIEEASKYLDADTKVRAIASAQEEYNLSLQGTNDKLRQWSDRQNGMSTGPLERYRAALEKINQAVARNLMTEQQATAAKTRAANEYKQELSSVERRHGGIAESAVSAASVVSESWNRAAATLSSIRAKMAEENQRALAQQESSGRSLGSLAQIANTPEELSTLTAQARGLVAKGAAKDMADAVNTIFAASSSGAMKDLPALTKLAAPGVIGNVPEFIRSAAALRAALGADQTGSISDIVAKSFAAAAPTTTTAEALGIGASRAASNARTLGVGLPELLSGTGILATARGSAEEGGTRMAALLRGFEDDQELRGKSFVDMLKTVRDRNLPPEELTKQLSAEGADAFRILAANMEQLEKTISETRATDTQRTIDTRAALALGQPAVEADLLARQRKAQGDLMRESEGRVLALQEAAIEQGTIERRRGARRGLAGKMAGMVAPPEVANEIDAMMYSGFMRNIFGAMPGNKLAESAAMSDRTAPELREALTKALVEREVETARQFASLKAATDNLTRAAEAMTRPAPMRQDWAGPARREASIPAE